MTPAGAAPVDPTAAALASIATESGTTLLALADESPLLLVFLRHFGCAFCRQAISDVAELRPELVKRGIRPVFVHLGPPELARVYFDYYGLNDVEQMPGIFFLKGSRIVRRFIYKTIADQPNYLQLVA